MNGLSPRAYRLSLLLCVLTGALVLALPVILMLFQPDYRGLMPYRGEDENLYTIRLQEALLHPWSFDSNGIWTAHPTPTAVQLMGMEWVAGVLFSWTGLNGLTIAFVLTVLLAPLSVPLVAEIARRCGAERHHALLLAILFFLATGLLRRAFNPAWSMPLTLLAILALIHWWQRPSAQSALLAGVAAGILPGVYLWSWTFVFAVAGFLGLFTFVERSSTSFSLRVRSLPVALLSLGIVSLPSFLQLWDRSRDPLFPEVSARMGLILSHIPESPMRSGLFLVLLLGVLLAFGRTAERERAAPLLSLCLALSAVQNQQLLHGRIMSFSSHYYMYACAVAAVVAAVFLSRRRTDVAALFSGGACLLILSSASIDYAGWQHQFEPPPAWQMAFQPLAPLIRQLNDGRRNVLLSDMDTLNYLASTTDDDVAFTQYSRILLIPTQEWVERYCMTQVFGPGPMDTRFVADFQRENIAPGQDQTNALYTKHLRMGQETCPLVQRDLGEYLRRYRVTHLVWNEHLHPDWKVDPRLFALDQRGEGWSLWSVR